MQLRIIFASAIAPSWAVVSCLASAQGTHADDTSFIKGSLRGRQVLESSTTRNARRASGKVTTTKLGVISYWWPTGQDYDSLPHGSMAVINPSNGIFDWNVQDTATLGPNICVYKQIAATAAARNIRMLGYVPTGYFKHDCDINAKCQTLSRIQAQITEYYRQFPNLAGIFFDEVAPQTWDCDAFEPEYATLRQLVKTVNADAKIAFNTGVPDNCVVNGVKQGEVLVLYERDVSNYGTIHDTTFQKDALWWSLQLAKSNQIETWHLVHTANKAEAQAALEKARNYGVDWFYATDIGGDWKAGENTWGSPAGYWDDLKSELHAAATPDEVQTLSATISADGTTLTLNRPAAQCCNFLSDWVGVYPKGSWTRLSYIHLYNGHDNIVAIPLDCLVDGLDAGVYEFKYVTPVDGWTAHSLTPKLVGVGSVSLPTSVYVWNYDVLGASSSGVSCANTPAERAAFRVFDPSDSTQVQALAIAQGVTTVFLDYYVWCVGHVPFPALYDAVKHIRASGKTVYALMTSDIVGVKGAEDGTLGHYKSWLAWSGNGLTCEQPNCEEGWVQGVAINIEHGVTANEFLSSTLSEFVEATSKAKNLGLKVHASLGHWWYDSHPTETGKLGDSVDSLDIQAYYAPCQVGSRGGCVNNARYPADWIEAAVRPELAKWGRKLSIGIETSPHVADRYSWSEEGEVAMWTFFENQLSAQPTYSAVGGFSVHFWNRSFRGGTHDWPVK